MNMAKEEYNMIKDFFKCLASTYECEFKEVNITLSVTVHHKEHDLSFMYIYGNRKMFVVDEFDPMQTMNVATNIRSLPDRVKEKIAEWKEKINGIC